MKEYAKILQLFTMKQRFMVLLVLLVFGSATYLIGTYFKTDDCSELVAENRALIDDYIKLSTIIREMGKESAEMAVNQPMSDSTSVMTPIKISESSTTEAIGNTIELVPIQIDRRRTLLDSALEIVNKKSAFKMGFNENR